MSSPGQTAFADSRLEWRRLLAEAGGTFFLVLAAAGGGVVNAVSHGQVGRAAAVTAPGLMVLALIYTIGETSGAHLNPAVTIAFAARGHFPWQRVPGYVLAQLCGAVLAAGLLRALFGSADRFGGTFPGRGIATSSALVIEIVLTFGLVTVILGTASGARNVGHNAAIAVGSYVALAGLWASPVSGASMNPARSLGPALVSGDLHVVWIYVAGPVTGGLIAVALAWALRGPGSAAADLAAQGATDEGHSKWRRTALTAGQAAYQAGNRSPGRDPEPVLQRRLEGDLVMKTIDDFAVAGQRVVVRDDLNVPLDGDRVADDGRIRAALPTLTALLDRDAKVIVCAHLGRPSGKPDPKYSLAPVAARLGELLGRPVKLAADITGPSARAAVSAVAPGGLVMLENLRFDERETSKDDTQRGLFADQLAELADLYVSDGFGVLHRKQASVYDIALRLPHAAGYLVRAEVGALRRLTADIRRPYVVVLGGAKVEDKFGAIGDLICVADRILIGGATAFPFLAAEGHKVGTSLLNADQVDLARGYLDLAARVGTTIILPSDLVVAPDRAAHAPHEVVAADAIPADQMGLDIGPETATLFTASLRAAGTVFWNGPMGVFELAPYAHGTRVVASALTSSEAFSVVGGGDTGAAIRALGFPDGAFGYVSTGGGASLELIRGKTLPGLAVLEMP
jgi:phosphoglycerate kinase